MLGPDGVLARSARKPIVIGGILLLIIPYFNAYFQAFRMLKKLYNFARTPGPVKILIFWSQWVKYSNLLTSATYQNPISE